MTHYGSLFFCLFLEKRGSVHSENSAKDYLYNLLVPLENILSSSHRGGGVAPDCMDFALKVSFPWLQAPFRLRSGVFSHPEWVATQFNLFFYLREIEDFWGSEEDERSDRPTDTNRKPQISKQIYMGVISSDSLSKMPESTYLIVDSCTMGVLFDLISAFLFSFRFPIISLGN